MSLSVRSVAVCLFATVLIVGLAGCGGSSSSSAQHLYVASDSATGQVLQYKLPITSTSTPTVSFTGAATSYLVALALDSNGNLAAGDNAGHLVIFNAPITNSSTASISFNNGAGTNNGQLVFNSAGDLFAPIVGNRINLFTHPLSSASTPSLGITDASLVQAIGAALDASGNLIVSNAGSGGGTGSNLAIFASPYTGAPVSTPVVAATAYRKLALSSTQLFVCSVSGATGRVDVYNLPLTASSAPAFAITNGINSPEALAFDSSGNLYVGNLGDTTIKVFSPPFSATSAPTTSLLVSSGTFAIFGMTIGK